MRRARSSPRTESVPAVMSEWPPMNLVALVMATSAPRSSGRWNTGAMMELSTHTSAPAACATRAIARMSHTWAIGDGVVNGIIMVHDVTGDKRYHFEFTLCRACSPQVTLVCMPSKVRNAGVHSAE